MPAFLSTTLMLMMASSLIVLVLVTIGRQSANSSSDLAHIRLFVVAILGAGLFLVIDGLTQIIGRGKNSEILPAVAVLFLIINTGLTLLLGTDTKKPSSGAVYYLMVTALCLAIINIGFDNLLIKMLASVAYMIIFTVLAAFTVHGEKKAEVAMKLAINVIPLLIFFILALLLISANFGSLSLGDVALGFSEPSVLALAGLLCLVFAGINMAGLPPFHFAFVDSAEAGQHHIALLLFSNSTIQGALLIVPVISLIRHNSIDHVADSIALMLAVSFLILWLRAIDQRKFLRTIVYVAASLGPLMCLALAFGKSRYIPENWYVFAIFAFLSLALYTTFASLVIMKPINNYTQTWEDISGFGRKHTIQTVFLLISVATIAGLPGTFGYFIKLSLLKPTQSLALSILMFLSIAIGAACVMRLFVFLMAKHDLTHQPMQPNAGPSLSLICAGTLLTILGLFPILH